MARLLNKPERPQRRGPDDGNDGRHNDGLLRGAAQRRVPGEERRRGARRLQTRRSLSFLFRHRDDFEGLESEAVVMAFAATHPLEVQGALAVAGSIPIR